MRKHLNRASAILALTLAACGCAPAAATPSPSSTPCIHASMPHHAYVVVQHLSGTTVQQCVGFPTETIDGQTLMDQSTIQFATQTFSYGKLACQIDNEPKQFTQCTSQGQPYWYLWVETTSKWTSAPTGFTDVKLRDKEALGWHYTQPTDPSPAPPPLAKT